MTTMDVLARPMEIALIIPPGTTIIEADDYKNITKFTTIEFLAAVVEIADRAFEGCTGLTSVTIPASVKTIGVDAFKGCTGLTSVTIPDSVETIGVGAFQNCINLIDITIPTEIISDFMCSGCSSLVTVTMNAAKQIGTSAFSQCHALLSVDISSRVETIGVEAFAYCNSLSNMVFRYEIIIGDRAFANCAGLTTLTFMENSTVGNQSFAYCGNLKHIVANGIPLADPVANVIPLADPVANGVPLADPVVQPVAVNAIKRLPRTHPVISIKFDAFDGCDGLETVDMPYSILIDTVFAGLESVEWIISGPPISGEGNQVNTYNDMTPYTLTMANTRRLRGTAPMSSSVYNMLNSKFSTNDATRNVTEMVDLMTEFMIADSPNSSTLHTSKIYVSQLLDKDTNGYNKIERSL